MENNIISIIGAIVILVLIIATAYVSIRNKKDGAKEATEFMNGLCDELLKIIFDTISTISPKDYKTAEEYEVVVLNAVYDKAWDYTKNQINVKFDNSSTLKLIINIIDKNYVIKFIDSICEKSGITDKIQGTYAAYQIETTKPVEIDNKLEQEYSDKEKYNTEEVKDEDLQPAEETVHTEEEIKALNPQRDEEEAYNPNDESMEVVDEKEETNKIVEEPKPNIIGIKNKSGNILYYEIDEDGKKKRVTKEYALGIIGDKVEDIDLNKTTETSTVESVEDKKEV